MRTDHKYPVCESQLKGFYARLKNLVEGTVRMSDSPFAMSGICVVNVLVMKVRNPKCIIETGNDRKNLE
jgi:hypothetical protein